MTRRRGFTLIEVLVVVAIIGLLSTIVIANVGSSRKKGNDARRIADIKQLQLALELYYDANGTYPNSLDLLASANYIPNIPKDPGNAASYAYALYALTTSPTVCVGYHLGASLEESGNSALSGDADVAGFPSGMQLCTLSGAPASDFSGADSGKCDSSHAGVACFDVRS